MTKSSAKPSSSMPEPVSIPLNKTALTINVRCGSCKFFKRIPNPAYGDVCTEKGVLDSSKPCMRYCVDPDQIHIKESEHIDALVQILEGISDKELSLVTALFNREHITRKRGFRFGMVVYLRPFGDDYVSNYRRAKVISADRTYVHIRASDGWIGSVYLSSVLKPSEWKTKKAQLERAGKITDPNYKKYFHIKTKAEVDIDKFLTTHTPLPLDASMQQHDVLLTVESTSNNRRKKSLRSTPLDELLRVRG